MQYYLNEKKKFLYFFFVEDNFSNKLKIITDKFSKYLKNKI